MKKSRIIKDGFYIKVNKKKSPKKENLLEKDLTYQEKFQTKTFNIKKSDYLTNEKQNNSEIKHFLSPKLTKFFKANQSNEKSIKQNTNTTPINKKYERKIIHIENRNKLNMFKSQTQFPLNNKNYLSKSEKNNTKVKSFFNSKNINLDNNKNSKKINWKVISEIRAAKNNINNNVQNSTINICKKKLKHNFYYPKIQYMQFHNNNKLIGAPKYSKTIINNKSQSGPKKKFSKKIKNKSKENIILNKKEINILDIYKSKLITIFVKLMNDFFIKQIKRIFNFFVYKIKDNFYFSYINKTYNWRINNNDNNFIKDKIYDYNNKINYKNIIGYNLTKTMFPSNDYQSLTMYHIKNKKNENKNNLYIPANNRYKENLISNKEEYYPNYHSNDKYNIFNDMKIEKNPNNIINNDNIYENQNQNINTQINNYYNTKNTNYYFNKINPFTSLIIEKQRPRYYFPKKNIKYTSPKKINNLSLNKKKKNYENLNSNLKTNIKNDLINTEYRTKNLIYRRIVSKENKNKINNEQYETFMNQTEKILDKKKTFFNYKNIINKDNINNYYTTINQNKRENNMEDISNDLNNYCLEDIDKPMNMIYSINDFEEEGNNDRNNIENFNRNKNNDKKLFMNFNYIIFNPKKKGKEFIYKNRKIIKKNYLSITKADSIFLLSKYELENKIKNDLIIAKLKNLMNNVIYIYKLEFFKVIKIIKFKSIILKIIENRKVHILKKYFALFKRNENSELKINPEEKIETKYYNIIESFRINILKFIFSKK